MVNKLSERKHKILKAVVEEYIKDAQPVSSGGIQSKYFSNISSATIRAELAALEDMGYLIQPHTSAGRRPTPKAYKYYVKHFVDRAPLRKEDVALIDASFAAKFSAVEDIVKTTAKVISDVTNYTSVIVIKNINKVTIKQIKLVGLDEHSALIIIITDSGIIRDKVIKLNNVVDDEFISSASLLVNKIFANKKVGELENSELLVQQELSEFRELFDNVISILHAYCEHSDEDVYMEGTSKLLDYPETDIQSAKNFLSIIDNKSMVVDLIDDVDDIEFSVKIGRDENAGIEKCAVITAKYLVNGKELGHAGVIGPERMDYQNVMSVLSYIGDALNTVIKKKGEDDGEEK
ncbi:MAG: heat-inducible transcription repressor HrcA [Clostridia bacterium]|nr:heat-inducible transcription repressor HrcA [Clostridia bacterium]